MKMVVVVIMVVVMVVVVVVDDGSGSETDKTDIMFSPWSIVPRESVAFALQYMIITVIRKNMRHYRLDMAHSENVGRL